MSLQADNRPERRSRRRGYAALIERAVAEEVKAGTSREDIEILRPCDRNARLNAHMHRLRLIPADEKLPDRVLRLFFNGR